MNLKKYLSILTTPTALFLISAVLLLFGLFRKRDNFFDVRSVFKDQFSIFNGAVFPIFLLYGVPAILSFATLKIKFVDKAIVDNLVVIQSIFLSMLFAMLSIVGSQDDKGRSNRRKLMNQTFNSIVFESIICIILLVISFAYLFTADGGERNIWINRILSFFVYYLMYTMILNTFIILKRMKVLFKE